MSVITDAVIFSGYLSREVSAVITEPIAADTERGQGFGELDLDAAGGVKVFCSHVYAAAFNYFGCHEIEAWFLALPWGSADSATLSVSSEDGSEVTVVIDHGQMVARIESLDYGREGRRTRVELAGCAERVERDPAP